jgi:hypothetical protein
MLVRAVETLMQSRPEDRPSTAAQAAELLGEACPKFFTARQPLARAVLTLTNVSMSSTFAVPDAMRAMMAAAVAGESPPSGVVVSAGADDRTIVPNAPVRDAPMTPFLDEGAMPRAIATDGAPSRSRARPTQYVRPLAKAGGRKRLLTLVLAGCVLVVGGGAAAVLFTRHVAPDASSPAEAAAAAPTPHAPAEAAAAAPTPHAPAEAAAATPTPHAPAEAAAATPTPHTPKRSKAHKAKPKAMTATPATAEIIVEEETPPLKEVKIDGVTLAVPVRFTVEPGRHDVSITRILKNGVEFRTRFTVDVAAGERREVK